MRYLLYLFVLLLLGIDTKSQKLTPEEYLETGRYIWNTYVPKSGQAQTVQGELLRSIENLADEAQRNGNINFNADCHGIHLSYLRKYLMDEKLFDKNTLQQINQDLDRLTNEKEPYLQDDLYDRLRDRIIDWYLQNKTPIPHHKNPKQYC